ncbi:MAG: AAA family ATPase, partial [Rhodoglobus sp.]
MSELQSAWPLVGRQGLLERITATLRSPAASVVILCGPSGVGKTRLAAETAALLESDGWLTVPVTASETMASIPLGALAPALSREPIDLAAAARDSVVLFEQVRRSIDLMAGGRRVLMVIDDLSLLDSLSLAVVSQLLAAGSLRLIATIRNGDPLPDAILSMWTNSSALRIDVPPLDLAGYEAVLGQVLSNPISHRTAVDLHAMSGGNPLFLRELVLGAIEEGQLVLADGVWQLLGEPIGTPGLHDLIRSRLQHLDPLDLALVERLAACQPLALSDITIDSARKRVIRLEAAGIVTVAEVGDRLLVSLAHPQYVAAVRSSLSRLRIIDNLLEQADIIAARPMSDEDELRVAVWRLDAGEPSDPVLLARAAHLAFFAHDLEAVSRLAAAAVLAGGPAAEMLYLQGEAQGLMGRNSLALELLERAAASDADDPGAEKLTGMIATARASTYAGELLGNSRGISLLDETVAKHPSLANSLALARAVLLLNLEEAGLAAEQLVDARPVTESESARAAILALSTAMPLSALGRSDAAIAAAREAVTYAAADPVPAFPLRRA